jgi:hypothetical protein
MLGDAVTEFLVQTAPILKLLVYSFLSCLGSVLHLPTFYRVGKA